MIRVVVEHTTFINPQSHIAWWLVADHHIFVEITKQPAANQSPNSSNLSPICEYQSATSGWPVDYHLQAPQLHVQVSIYCYPTIIILMTNYDKILILWGSNGSSIACRDRSNCTITHQNCGHEYYKRINCEKASRHKYIKILKKLLGITKSVITGQQGDTYTGRQVDR